MRSYGTRSIYGYVSAIRGNAHADSPEFLSSSITDISHGLNIAKQQMTTVINKLVEARLVEKTADIHDRRRFVITMTKAGQTLLDEQNELIRQRFYQHSQKLSKEENQQLAKAIQTYNQLISKMFA